MTYVLALEALADGTRRELLQRLRERPHAVGELAHVLRVSQPAVSQHLRVLSRARLVSARAEGRRRIYSLTPDGLVDLRRYLESFWRDVLVAFAADDPAPPARSAPSRKPLSPRPRRPRRRR
jgi:DNA-binding transcriptional ArsR family regulator